MNNNIYEYFIYRRLTDYRVKIKNRVLRLHATGLNDLTFQVCTKVTILLYLFDLVKVSVMKLTSY